MDKSSRTGEGMGPCARDLDSLSKSKHTELLWVSRDVCASCTTVARFKNRNALVWTLPALVQLTGRRAAWRAGIPGCGTHGGIRGTSHLHPRSRRAPCIVSALCEWSPVKGTLGCRLGLKALILHVEHPIPWDAFPLQARRCFFLDCVSPGKWKSF